MVTTASTVKRCGALRAGASSWKAVLSWLFGGGPGGESFCRERNQRKARIKVMAMKSRSSSASSITDKTEDPNQRLHWFPSWDSRVTTCRRWRKSSEDSPCLGLLPPYLFPLSVVLGGSPHPAPGKETQYPAMVLEQKLVTVEGRRGGMSGPRRHGSKACTVKAGDSPLVL